MRLLPPFPISDLSLHKIPHTVSGRLGSVLCMMTKGEDE